MDHGRRDGADRARRDGHRRGNGGQQPCGRGPRAPGCDCDYGAACFRPRAGVDPPGVTLGGPCGRIVLLKQFYHSSWKLPRGRKNFTTKLSRTTPGTALEKTTLKSVRRRFPFYLFIYFPKDCRTFQLCINS